MYAFRECFNLKTVGLGANSKLNYIGWGAFVDCSSLNSIRIPSSVTRIDTNAFYGCTGIESVYISDVAEWCKIDFQAIDANPLYYGAGNLYLNGNLVTYLGIPDNVTKISSFAFYGCDSIVDVAIGNGVRTIGVGAFYNCSNLSNVTFGDSVTTVEAWAFKDCLRLENVVFADKVFSVGDDAFYGCSNLEGVYITDITKWCTIEFYDYYSNPLYYAKKLYLNRELVTNLVIPTGVTSIGKYAFYNNDNIVTVTIPNTLKISGACAFDGCKNITTVNINNIEAWYNIKFEGETSTPVYYAKNLYINGELLTSLEIKNGVTEIGPYTFLYCTSLTSLIIPDSVTNIGTYAFLGCQVESATIPSVAISAIPKKALKTVIITSGSSIPNNAFSDCQNLESVKIPYSVYSIGDYAFENCSRLENIKIPSSVDSIGAYALYNCRSLRSINIPDSVASIGNYAFSGCYKLVEVINKSSLNIVAGDSSYGYVAYYAIEVHSGASKIVEEDGYFFYIYSGGNYLFGCRDIETKLILPETYRGENYKISDYAFYECKDVEEIYFNAIAMNDLNENNYAFEYVGQNSNGIKVVIGKNVTKIPAYLFSSSPKITSVEFEEGSVCKSIGSSAFSWCESLKTITIPESVISIGEDAFEFCRALEEIYFNAIAMSDCSSRSGVFEYAGQNGKVIIGKNVTKIPAYLFDNSDIINVEFEEGSVCQSIGGHAFSYCTSLESITIPSSVTSIGGYAFSVCPSLKYNEYDNAYYLGNDANPYLVLVKAKDTSITSCDINDNTKIVYYDAFYGCTSLDSIEIPSSVISVYGDVFHGCKKLKSVVFGNNSQLTSIGDDAFYGCSSLTSIEIPASVTNIGAYAFHYCTSLESVTFGNNGQLISISSHAFSYCTSLASIEIPNSVTSIGDYAFYCCTSLTSIEIPNSVESIGDNAFSDCTSLEGVTFGNDSQLISMGHYAFADCTSLTNVEIPNSVTSIGMGAFKECINLAYNKYGKCFYLGNDTNPYLVLVCMYGFGSDFSVHASTKIICLNAFYNASSITFENPNGWWCSLDFDATSGTSISATDLANPETAATYLNSTYCNYYWKRT